MRDSEIARGTESFRTSSLPEHHGCGASGQNCLKSEFRERQSLKVLSISRSWSSLMLDPSTNLLDPSP